MKKMVIFGTGSLGQLAYFHFSKAGQYEVAAFTVNEEYLEERKVFGLDVVAYEKIETTHPPEAFSMFVAIGYKRLNRARAEIYTDCRTKGYELVSCISTGVIGPEHVRVGDNCLIMPHTIVQPFAEIGNDVIIWGGSCIGYQSRVGDHSYIAPAAVIAGFVEIGQYCFVGANATVRDGLAIAPDCVIGAGAVILKDTERGRVYRAQSAEMLPYSSSELRYFK
jgi:sugar O-acyltransferase (sialic acid O-acetyltransferase NeuD family)